MNELKENEIKKMLAQESISDVKETDHEALVSKVMTCINNYKLHYGEKPTEEMVGYILDIPIEVTSEIMQMLDDVRYKL